MNSPFSPQQSSQINQHYAGLLYELAQAGMGVANALQASEKYQTKLKSKYFKDLKQSAKKFSALPPETIQTDECSLELNARQIAETYLFVLGQLQTARWPMNTIKHEPLTNWAIVTLKQASLLIECINRPKPKRLARAVRYWVNTYSHFKIRLRGKPKEVNRFTKQQKRINKVLSSLGTLAVWLCLGRHMEWRSYLSLIDAAPQGKTISLQWSPPTKSGSKVAMINQRIKSGKMLRLVFKSGQTTKLKNELRGIKRWQRARPGLAPKVIGFHQAGEKSSIVLEKVAGETFESIVLEQSENTFDLALDILINTLSAHWQKTTKTTSFQSDFMQQTLDRFESVKQVHPKLVDTKPSNSEVDIYKLLIKARDTEAKLRCPCPVLMHGDMNIDNILIDTKNEGLHFVDLHRAALADYLQDATVLIVSGMRLTPSNGQAQQRLQKRVPKLIDKVSKLAEHFAMDQKDKDFDYRFALGIARSCITSTRFIQNTKPAKKLINHAQAIVEEVIRHHSEGKKLKLNYRKDFYVQL